MKFREFEETFFAACKENRNSPGELEQKRLALTNHLLPYFGDMELEAIGPKDVRKYKDDKASDDYSAKTINNHLTILSRYLSAAREEGALSTPKWTIRMLTLDATEARFLSDAEVVALIKSAEQEENPEWVAMIRLGLNTGLRVGELLGLNWADVNLNGSVRTIRVTKSLCRVTGKIKKPKNGMKRDVALNPRAASVLKAMPYRAGPVFTMSYQGAYSAMKRITERAELDHVGWHTLRHTFASALVSAGKPLMNVMHILGHQSLRMTERYAHLSLERNKDIVADLPKAMGV